MRDDRGDDELVVSPRQVGVDYLTVNRKRLLVILEHARCTMHPSDLAFADVTRLIEVCR